MIQLMWEGGYMMWVILAVAVLVVGLGVRSWLRLREIDGPDPVVETGIDAVLFWGAWAVVVGLFGTFMGIYQAATAISSIGAQSVSAALVWGGIRVALTTTLFGLLVFTVASLGWIGLRTRYRRLAA